MISRASAMMVLSPAAALVFAGFVALPAHAHITLTASCVDGGGHTWTGRSVWGAEYVDSSGVKRIINTTTGFKSIAVDATTVDYKVKSVSGSGTVLQTLAAADERYTPATWRDRNPLNPPSAPGKAKITVSLGDGNDGYGNCAMTFVQPAPAPPPVDNDRPPVSGGYFDLLPAGALLPTDAQCVSRVRRSTWEPRPQNATANRTHPPTGYVVNGYGGMSHPDQTWDRVNGQASGTTDELIQHYACKWGLPDDVMRAEAVAESSWYQGLKNANGNPINGRGYGDFGHCSGGPYGSSGPASLGVMQIKACAHPGTLAYSEKSTAFNLDYYGAVVRGCVNGWDYVTSTTGDLWGCVGRWFSGDWYDSGAQSYISSVRGHLGDKPWLRWVG